MHLKRFIKAVIIPSIILMTAYVYIESTGVLVSYDNYLFHGKLKQEIKTGKNIILLEDLTNFEWDKVCFYSPYSYSFLNENSSIEEGDGLYTIEFLNNKKIILVTNLKRDVLNSINIEQNIPSNCFGKKAKFIIYKNKIINMKDD